MLPSAPPLVTQPRAEPVVQPDVGSAAQPHVEAAAQPVVDTVAQPRRRRRGAARSRLCGAGRRRRRGAARSRLCGAVSRRARGGARSRLCGAAPAEAKAQAAVEAEAQPHVEAAAHPVVDAVEQHAAPDEAPTVASDRFTTTGALLATVADGSVRPLSGKYLIRLAEGWMGFWAKIFDFYPASFDGSPF